MATITDLSSGTEYIDRYEFSPADSELWLQLFAMADAEIGEPLASVLQYIRNTGAILVESDRYGYIIKPVIGTEGWSSREEYEQERGMLNRHREKLLELLRRLAT